VTFRPIDVKMGPDGAIYIADWYNPIIQHGEVDFRDERRDRTHGRIWRVTAKGRPALPRIDFTKLSTPELLGHLKSPESYARDMAKRVLFARGSEAVVPELTKWLASLDSLDPDFERLRLEALRLRQGLDRGSRQDVDAGLLKAVLASPDPRARAAAARIVCDWADRLDAPVELLAPSVDDPSALVRLEGVRALATLGGRRAAELALHAVDHERDDALDYAVWLAARETKDAWLPAVLDGTFADDGRFGRMIFAVAAAEAAGAVPRIVALLQNGNTDGKISDADRQAALSTIAKLGTSDQLRVVFDVVANPATPPAQAAALLGDLLDSHKRRHVAPSGDVSAIEKLVASPDDACATRAIEATAAWDVTAATDELAGIAEPGIRSAAVRNAAITALGGLPGDQPRAALLKLCSAAGNDEAFTSSESSSPAAPAFSAAISATVSWPMGHDVDLRRQLLHEPEDERRPPARLRQFRAPAARRHPPALARGRRDLQPRLPGRPRPLSIQPHQDDEDERDGGDQRARHGEALSGEGLAGLDERGLRRPRGAPAAGELPRRGEPDRPAGLLRRGQAGRRDALHGLPPRQQASTSASCGSSTRMARGCIPTTAAWSPTSSARRSPANRSRSSARAGRPAAFAIATTSSRG
jgi:hypothetical protein